MRDLQKHKETNHQWYLRKKLGLPTNTIIKLTNEELKQHSLTSKQTYRQKQKKYRKEQLVKKFGEVCSICGDNYYLQIHKKDGKPHRQWGNMNNTEFWLLISSDDFVQLCFNCHKSVHWCMYYLNMCWDEIKKKVIPTILLKNKYHM